MTRMDYDLTVLGGGSGGLTAARIAASLGARVLLIDKERLLQYPQTERKKRENLPPLAAAPEVSNFARATPNTSSDFTLGGDCLYTGCVPSKSLIHVAKLVQQARTAASLGLTSGPVDIDMAQVADYIQGVIARVHEAEHVYTKDVTVKIGAVSFQSPTTLTLNTEKISSRTTIIATGSHPAHPALEGLAEVGYLTNEDVFQLTHLPASLLIVGGGPVGVELGQALTRLGVQVILIQGPERILSREDLDISEAIAQVLTSEGVELVTGARVLKAEMHGTKKCTTVKKGEQILLFETDEILLAAGRQPNVAGLNLEAAGIAYTTQGIQVNDYLQTSTATIFALGDVIGGNLFTHVAAYQAGVAARNALLPIGKKKVDYRVLPWCTFTDPEAARVGLTPEQAEKQHRHVRVVTFPWSDIDRAQTENATSGFIKFVLAGKKDEIVGAHLVGSGAGELLGEIALAMQHHLKIADILATIHPYPTLNTGIQQVAFEAYLSGAAARTNRTVVHTALRLRR